jgi:hypothetical protein
LNGAKKRGQRKATGIFTYTHPVNKTQEEHNQEALILEVKKSEMIIDAQGIGTGLVASLLRLIRKIFSQRSP